MLKIKNGDIVVLSRGLTLPDKTRGVLQYQGETLCYTLEEPYRGNAKGVSCILPGLYKVVRHGWEANATTHFKRVWRLLDVQGREAILIHAGNTTADTEGCILVGKSISDGGVGRSQEAVQYLRDILPETFMLEVRGSL